MRCLERTTTALASLLDRTRAADFSSEASGLLQRIDPRAKLAALSGLILTAASVQHPAVCLGLLGLATGLAVVSRISLSFLCRGVWVTVLLFAGTIALPAIFLTRGPTWHTIPGIGWNITEPGTVCAIRLVVRAESTATLAVLLVLTTPFNDILKALRTFHIPSVIVVILGMTYRFIALLLQSAIDLFEARRLRIISKLSLPQRAKLMTATTGVILDRSLKMSEEVYDAMLARGYRGEPASLDHFRMTPLDWLALAVTALVITTAFGWDLFLHDHPHI